MSVNLESYENTNPVERRLVRVAKSAVEAFVNSIEFELDAERRKAYREARDEMLTVLPYIEYLKTVIEEMARDLIAPLEAQTPMGMADYYATQVAPSLRAMGFDVPRFDDSRFYDHEAPPQGCVEVATRTRCTMADYLTSYGDDRIASVSRGKYQAHNRFDVTDAEGNEYEVEVRPKGKH